MTYGLEERYNIFLPIRLSIKDQLRHLCLNILIGHPGVLPGDACLCSCFDVLG
jgi:hypothetical protein